VICARLIAWALNADALNSTTNNDNSKSPSFSSWKYQYTTAATCSYLFASSVMEIIGSFSLLGNRGGLPALVFLVPTMLAFVTAVSWRRGELDEVWGDG